MQKGKSVLHFEQNSGLSLKVIDWFVRV